MSTTPRFTLIDRLGAGGFGEVWRAREETSSGFSRVVAIKLLHPQFQANDKAVKRFAYEAKLLSRIPSARVPRFYDMGHVDGRMALITEYIDGINLDEVLQDQLPVAALLEVVGEVADILAWAWSRPDPQNGKPLQLVHRDIKPSNIRLRAEGGVCLLDFGLSVSESVTRSVLQQGRAGTPLYMAPETFQLGEVFLPASDIFALGCVLYEGLRGEPFLHTGQFAAILANHIHNYRSHKQTRLAELPAGLPEPLVASLAQMLEYDPQARPSASDITAICFAQARAIQGTNLRQFIRGLNIPAPSPARESSGPANISNSGSSRGTLSFASFGDSMSAPNLSSSEIPSDGAEQDTNASIVPLSTASSEKMAATSSEAREAEPPHERHRSRWPFVVAGMLGLGIVVWSPPELLEPTTTTPVKTENVVELSSTADVEPQEADTLPTTPPRPTPPPEADASAPQTAGPLSEKAVKPGVEPLPPSPEPIEPVTQAAEPSPAPELAPQPSVEPPAPSNSPSTGTVILKGASHFQRAMLSPDGSSACNTAFTAVPAGHYRVCVQLPGGTLTVSGAAFYVAAGETVTRHCSGFGC